jgi:hypothetical protein
MTNRFPTTEDLEYCIVCGTVRVNRDIGTNEDGTTRKSDCRVCGADKEVIFPLGGNDD